jgi:hypothetical protein
VPRVCFSQPEIFLAELVHRNQSQSADGRDHISQIEMLDFLAEVHSNLNCSSRSKLKHQAQD